MSYTLLSLIRVYLNLKWIDYTMREDGKIPREV